MVGARLSVIAALYVDEEKIGFERARDSGNTNSRISCLSVSDLVPRVPVLHVRFGRNEFATKRLARLRS